jgi:hypothetical protein
VIASLIGWLNLFNWRLWLLDPSDRVIWMDINAPASQACS